MSEKSQHKNILITIACSTAVVAAVAIIGSLSLKQEPETIQGQVEVSEYRVSSKVPGRILELRVKEGDYVNVGDTLAILIYTYYIYTSRKFCGNLSLAGMDALELLFNPFFTAD